MFPALYDLKNKFYSILLIEHGKFMIAVCADTSIPHTFQAHPGTHTVNLRCAFRNAEQMIQTQDQKI